MVAEVKELHSNSTQIERMQRIFDAQKAAYRQHPYPSAEQRIELISRIKPLLLDNLDAWTEAINNDFTTRAVDETKLAEILITLEGLKYTTKKLRKWMKPQKRSVSTLSWPGMRPATGCTPKVTATPDLVSIETISAIAYCAFATARPYLHGMIHR